MVNPNTKISRRCRDRFHDQCHNPMCICGCHRKTREKSLNVSDDAEKTFQQAAEEAVAQMGSQPSAPSQLDRHAQVTGQAITALAYAKRDLDDARARGETDMMRYSLAMREAEANLNRAIEGHCNAIIASERNESIPNALENWR